LNGQTCEYPQRIKDLDGHGRRGTRTKAHENKVDYSTSLLL
jgi:hypothetical protein